MFFLVCTDAWSKLWHARCAHKNTSGVANVARSEEGPFSYLGGVRGYGGVKMEFDDGADDVGGKAGGGRTLLRGVALMCAVGGCQWLDFAMTSVWRC